MSQKRAQSAQYGISTAQARESFGKVKVNLEFLSVDGNYRCFMLASAMAGEGKSTVAANLAVSMAASDNRVLLVDADLRHPTQHRLFSIVNKVGLSDIIAGNLNWRDYASAVVAQNLRVITAGRMPPNPAELLGSRRMGELVQEFKNEYDIVLIDSSPVLLVPDPVSLSKHVDGIIVVARYHFTSVQAVTAVCEALKLASRPIVGSILNNVSSSGARYEYTYGGTYGRPYAARNR